MSGKTIDINCDLGEGFGAYALGDDAALMACVSSVNIACGFHAGDPHIMRRTVAAAAARGLGLGAHPGYPDRLGFGRRPFAATVAETQDFLVYQIGALQAFATAAGARLSHVKLHGALFHTALEDPVLASALCAASRALDPGLAWLAPAGPLADAAERAGLVVIREFYADRAYHADLRLVSRQTAGAVIDGDAAVRARVSELLAHGTVATIEGRSIRFAYDSICVHGDTPHSLAIARAVRELCAQHGIAVQPFGRTA